MVVRTFPLLPVCDGKRALMAASAPSTDTVLSALNLGKVTAPGFVRVNKFSPIVLAPKLVLHADGFVSPALLLETVPIEFHEMVFAVLPSNKKGEVSPNPLLVTVRLAVVTAEMVMFAEPLKLTPLIVLAVSSVVAVKALPEHAVDVVAF